MFCPQLAFQENERVLAFHGPLCVHPDSCFHNLLGLISATFCPLLSICTESMKPR